MSDLEKLFDNFQEYCKTQEELKNLPYNHLFNICFIIPLTITSKIIIGYLKSKENEKKS